VGAVAAAVMLVALIAVAYAVDVASEKRLRSLVDQPQFEQFREQQKLLKIVARHRPDMLELLTDINSGETGGVILDSLSFKKGQKVTIMGQADNEERLWAFQENLRGRKGLADVQISAAIPDKKTKKIKFTMNFHYRQFTKKEAVL
jgi:Tfp pilus assembly protein PilN